MQRCDVAPSHQWNHNNHGMCVVSFNMHLHYVYVGYFLSVSIYPARANPTRSHPFQHAWSPSRACDPMDAWDPKCDLARVIPRVRSQTWYRTPDLTCVIARAWFHMRETTRVISLSCMWPHAWDPKCDLARVIPRVRSQTWSRTPDLKCVISRAWFHMRDTTRVISFSFDPTLEIPSVISHAWSHAWDPKRDLTHLCIHYI